MLINCARGGVVSEQGLLQCLDSGHIAAAGLDVFAREPPAEEDATARALLAHDRTSVSPHTGANTAEAQLNVGVQLAEQIVDYFAVGREAYDE
jgi:D-3-phosphoglycerate dehydrogenase